MTRALKICTVRLVVRGSGKSGAGLGGLAPAAVAHDRGVFFLRVFGATAVEYFGECGGREVTGFGGVDGAGGAVERTVQVGTLFLEHFLFAALGHLG